VHDALLEPVRSHILRAYFLSLTERKKKLTHFSQRRYRRYKEAHGRDPPAEFRLLMGQVGGVLVPLALLWLALSTYRSVHWIVPVLASVPFGTGTYFIFTSSFTYIVVAYRPLAASALACNTTMRTSFAAAFPLFAGQMYRALGTVGATLLLAGLTMAMAPLPFVLYHMGSSGLESSRNGIP